MCRLSSLKSTFNPSRLTRSICFWQLKKTYIFVFFYCPTYNQQQYSVNWNLSFNLWRSRHWFRVVMVVPEVCTLLYSSTKECIKNHNSFLTEIESIAFAGKRVPIILPIDSYVKFTDFEKFSLLYYTWSREGTTLIWKFNPSTIQKSHEKGRFAGHL